MYAANFITYGGNVYSFIAVTVIVVGWGTWVTKRSRAVPRMSNRKMIREIYKLLVGEEKTEFEPRRIGMIERMETVEKEQGITYTDGKIDDAQNVR